MRNRNRNTLRANFDLNVMAAKAANHDSKPLALRLGTHTETCGRREPKSLILRKRAAGGRLRGHDGVFAAYVCRRIPVTLSSQAERGRRSANG